MSNVPTFTKNWFAFGPGVVFIGAAGSTPTEEWGAIDRDNPPSFELATERREILQGGGGAMVVQRLNIAQRLSVSFGGLEVRPERIHQLVGSGAYTTTASEHIYTFGGEPLPDDYAIHIRNVLPKSGYTQDWYIWEANGDGNLSYTMSSAEEHKVPATFQATRVTTDWAGNALASGAQLFKAVTTIS